MKVNAFDDTFFCYSGIRNNHTKQDLIRTVKGPMSSDLDGLILSTKALTSERMFNCDSSIPPIPFNENIFNSTKKLKVGFFTGSGVCQVLPPMKRVVAECAKHFENLGFEVEEWNPPLLVECANDYFFEVILSESGNTMSSILKKDLVDKSIAKYIKIFHFPDVIKRILPFWSYFVECGFEKTLYKYITGIRSYDQWKNVYKNILVARDEIKKSWIKHNFDIVLFPAFTCPAFDSKLIGKIHGACWPTMYFNLADFPSGVFPYSSLTSQDMNDIQNFQSNQKYLNKLKTICKQAEGFPLSVQIAAMPFKEEKILLAMKNLKNILN
ncbi:hypothetical protein A3Q56_07571 [Intoshia linei]|uniref:Amidase domain-containing protein n=1 Tax=Intoshia linei TaxID=1819745 RepID=A0A177ARS9_9BILA|nr:hypothetical protein A3Q56_07571 [Intoshia linei]